jgi:hypothetical protein
VSRIVETHPVTTRSFANLAKLRTMNAQLSDRGCPAHADWLTSAPPGSGPRGEIDQHRRYSAIAALPVSIGVLSTSPSFPQGAFSNR